MARQNTSTCAPGACGHRIRRPRFNALQLLFELFISPDIHISTSMNKTTSQLIAAARAVYGEFALLKDFSAGSVGAALRTAGGNIYTGVCIELACGLGFCAEAAAIAEMLKHHETHITDIVAISSHGILAPCGRCREMIVQVDARNFDCHVIIGEDRIVPLRQLLPDHWLVKNKETT
jgi:cytidine deaminase